MTGVLSDAKSTKHEVSLLLGRKALFSLSFVDSV